MKKWSLSFRIWHWAHAFIVIGLLVTVFLRKTFLSWRANSEIIMLKLSSMDIVLSSDQAKVIAKAIRAPMWEWHIILGYGLSMLVLIRLVLFFTQSGQQNFIDIKSLNIHKKMVSLGYLGIYTVLIFMSMSGLVLNFHEELGLIKETTHDIKEIHELVFNAVWIFVLLHIGGVVVAETTDEKGLVSKMINGGNEKKSE